MGPRAGLEVLGKKIFIVPARITISRPVGVKDNFSIFSQLNCNVCHSCGLLKTLTMVLDTALTRVKQYRC